MGIFDKSKEKEKKDEIDINKMIEEDDEFASIIDEAANEALAEMGLADARDISPYDSEMGLADDEEIGNEETRKQIEEGFDNEAQKEIEDEVKKEMESEDVQKKIEDEVKKKFGFLG